MHHVASRTGALREALRRLLERPAGLLLALGSAAFVLATLLLGALLAWRALPLATPAWMQPQALVLVAGAEGEVDLGAVRASLAKVEKVQSIDFFGRDAALAELAQRKALSAVGLNELHPNPLPDSFSVRFAPGAAPEAIEAAVAGLRKVQSVEAVVYQPEAYRRFFLLWQSARRLSMLLAVAIALALAGGIALAARSWMAPDRPELALLQMLGADPATMRRPYVYGGAATLGLAAACAWWTVTWTFGWIDPVLADLAREFSLHWSGNPLRAWWGAPFCLAAALLGAILASLHLRTVVARNLPECR